MNEANDSGADEIPSLPAAQYHLIVSPVLQVTAELAAVRGDPDLYNDMASMLALMALVRALADCCLEAHPDESPAVREAIEAAPAGACVMVLNRGELIQEQISDCIWALETATRQLVEARVLGRERKLAREAWRLLGDGDREGAIQRLKLAATGIVNAVDQWEREREQE